MISDHVHWVHGYAFLSDRYLARESRTDLSNVPRVLKILEDAGAIVRAHVRTGTAETERRIWLAEGIAETQGVPVTPTGPPTSHGDCKPPVGVTGQRLEREKKAPRDGGFKRTGGSFRQTYSSAMAKADAEAREHTRAAPRGPRR